MNQASEAARTHAHPPGAAASLALAFAGALAVALAMFWLFGLAALVGCGVGAGLLCTLSARPANGVEAEQGGLFTSYEPLRHEDPA